MSEKIFSYPLTIKENHLDTFGHVNNATYLTLLEEARWEIATQNGYGLEKIMQTGLAPTILEVHLRFLKELRLRETIIINTQFISYQGKVGRIDQKIMRDDQVCCTAEFTIGLFSLAQRKIVEPTAEWLHAMGISA